MNWRFMVLETTNPVVARQQVGLVGKLVQQASFVSIKSCDINRQLGTEKDAAG